MYKRMCICSAILLITLSLWAAPALGISTVTIFGRNGHATLEEMDGKFDDSTRFGEKTLGGSGVLYQNTEVTGSGENSLEYTVSGDDYTVMNAFQVSGTVNSQILGAASCEGAVTSFKTDCAGDAGYVVSGSSTGPNDMMAMGWFSGGDGYMSSDLMTVASDRAAVVGSTDMLGVNGLDEEISGNIASGGDILMNLEGLYGTSSGDLGSFGMLAINNEKSNGFGRYKQPSNSVENLEGDEDSYILAGWKWVDNPNIQLYVKSDRYLSREGLTSTQAKNAISSAAETWDAETSQNLFNDNVIVSSRVKTDKYDRKNVHAWKYISSSAIAYARTYYYPTRYVTGADGNLYWQAVESDVCYNTRYGWGTYGADGTPYRSGDKIDVQSVALHELGHTVGLGDIYGTDLAWDSDQIMNSYNDIQRTLGAGDVTGIQRLYGA